MSGTELELPQDTGLHIETPEAAPIDPPDRELSAREKMLESIYANRAKVVEHELGTAADIGFAVPDAEVEPNEDPTAELAAEPTAKKHQPALKPEDAPQSVPRPHVAAEPAFHVIEIEGQQYRVDDAQMRELARMGAMANIAIARQQSAPEPVAPVHVPAAAPEIDAADIYQRIAYGTKEDGEAAVRELALLMQKQQAPAVDPNAIAQSVRVQLRQEMTLEQNLQTIAGEYPDIFNSTGLSRLAAIELHEARQEFAMRGVQKSDLDLYREACNRVRQVIQPGQQSQSAVGQPQAAIQAAPAIDRLERKRAAPRNPTAVSRSAGVALEAPRPPTGSEIVDRLRRARGQSPLMN